MQSLNDREQLFVALGAAIGSNCVPCVESIVPKAKGAGIEDWELRLAVHAADLVRQKPAAKVLATAKAIIDGAPDEVSSDEACPLNQMESPPAIGARETTQIKSKCCG